MEQFISALSDDRPRQYVNFLGPYQCMFLRVEQPAVQFRACVTDEDVTSCPRGGENKRIGGDPSKDTGKRSVLRVRRHQGANGRNSIDIV